ncbi:zinc finger protein-domain-containing protein [Dactylonectria estremocensis]|uniref:Zinc finger protein-domain-containing protein n=1 Tax=Dactylonectria estremocensis TaxID=1079267 RepID=A0A9P9FCN7_9HYPO|nr:zinc finger protein-domain-containing protein [Dactylonectria estremocensis]
MSHNRRHDAASDESYKPARSPTYELDLAANMELLNILEPLNQALALNHVTSTRSTVAKRQSEAQHEQSGDFKKIGAGACGIIFAQRGKSMVIKLAKNSDSNELWNDFLQHKLIAESFSFYDPTAIKLPKCYGFIPKDRSEFWDINQSLSRIAEPLCHLPTHGLCTERILPLPEVTRQLLIDKYLRVYLGSLRGRSGGMFFSLRNFKLHLNQLVDLRLDVTTMALSMGSALAIMHWAAQTDARDVEFVLGSITEPLPTMSAAEAAALLPNSWTGPPSDNLEDFHHRKTALWLLDFNQVRHITMDEDGLALAVEAFKLNDPYYPKPLQDDTVAKDLWNTFAKSYLEMSQIILRSKGSHDIQQLPGQFLKAVINMQRQKKNT